MKQEERCKEEQQQEEKQESEEEDQQEEQQEDKRPQAITVGETTRAKKCGKDGRNTTTVRARRRCKNIHRHHVKDNPGPLGLVIENKVVEAKDYQ